MDPREIIGRREELGVLQEICESRRPQFLAVYGRLRIGKTFLIRRFFGDKGTYFELTGIKDTDIKTQLGHFAREYADVFQEGKPTPPPVDWFAAFDLLRKQAQQKNRERLILFFDELPWLASRRSQFLAALDHSWNRYFSRESDLAVIICGSDASWMIQKVLYDTGGLHGRLTQQIRLLPFTLAEARLFLEDQHVRLPPRQFLELYMSVGGVAKHLTQMHPGRSADQLIQDRYFQEKTVKHAGCQVDYLVQTRYSLHVIEIRFSRKPIMRDVHPEAQEKLDTLVTPRNLSVRPVLVHVNGVADSGCIYSTTHVTSSPRPTGFAYTPDLHQCLRYLLPYPRHRFELLNRVTMS